jgi:hypothetical protein
MSDKEKNQKASKGSTEDLGQAQLQQAANDANEQGYIGSVPDPTPNDNYTVSGVTSGAPTPETDPALREEVDANLRRLAREGGV